MTLNLKNVKGYDRLPYCQVYVACDSLSIRSCRASLLCCRHYPQPKPTAIVDNPEMQRMRLLTDIQSTVRQTWLLPRSRYMTSFRPSITKISIRARESSPLLLMILFQIVLRNINVWSVKLNIQANEKRTRSKCLHKVNERWSDTSDKQSHAFPCSNGWSSVEKWAWTKVDINRIPSGPWWVKTNRDVSLSIASSRWLRSHQRSSWLVGARLWTNVQSHAQYWTDEQPSLHFVFNLEFDVTESQLKKTDPNNGNGSRNTSSQESSNQSEHPTMHSHDDRRSTLVELSMHLCKRTWLEKRFRSCLDESACSLFVRGIGIGWDQFWWRRYDHRVWTDRCWLDVGTSFDYRQTRITSIELCRNRSMRTSSRRLLLSLLTDGSSFF